MDPITHPIHRMPVEIIQKIFEETAYDTIPSFGIKRSRLRNSIAVSHTCKSWRAIALQTPSLWANVEIQLEKSQRYIEEQWSRMMERVKDIPLSVHVALYWDYGKLPRTFDEMRSIDTLSFEYVYPKQFRFLLKDDFPVPRCPIKKVTIWIRKNQSMRDLSDSEEDVQEYIPPPIPINQRLSRWPPISSLRISGANLELKFTQNFPLKETHELSLHHQDHISLNSLNQAFPNLRVLDFGNLNSIEWTNPTTFNNVTKLILSRVPTSFLSCIQCPLLTTLLLLTTCPDGLVDFLDAHPTVRILETSSLPFIYRLSFGFRHIVLGSGIPEVAQVAPQLQEFAVWGNSSRVLYDLMGGESSNALFPNLVNVTVWDNCQTISLDEFDEFVRRRCLPLSHPEAIAMKDIRERVRVLTIVYYNLPSFSQKPEWRTSRYCGFAKETTYYNKPIPGVSVYTTTTLEWIQGG